MAKGEEWHAPQGEDALICKLMINVDSIGGKILTCRLYLLHYNIYNIIIFLLISHPLPESLYI